MTTKQQASLEFIRQYHAAHGIAPTTRMIAEHFGISQNAAVTRIAGLVHAGHLSKCPTSGRLILAGGQDARVAALEAENARLREALRVILPMAKGYAHEHPVGNNAFMVQEAELALAEDGKEGA